MKPLATNDMTDQMKKYSLALASVVMLAYSHVAYAGVADVASSTINALTTVGGDTSYTFLAPLSILRDIQPTIDLNTGFDAYIRAVIDLVIGLIAVIGVYRLIKVGVNSIANPDKADTRSKARAEIMNIAKAFLLIAGSYALLNTINPSLVGTANSLIEPVQVSVNYSLQEATDKRIEIPTGDDAAKSDDPQTRLNSTSLPSGWYIYINHERVAGKEESVMKFIRGSVDNSGVCGDMARQIHEAYKEGTTEQDAQTFLTPGVKNCYEKKYVKVSEDESQIRATLQAAGVFVNRTTTCSSIVQSGCTNVGSYVDGGKTYPALSPDVISKIISLAGENGQNAQNCTTGYEAACAVMVTGGTEWWPHKSHGTPFVFDLRRTPKLINFLYSHATVQAIAFGGHPRYFYNGIWFVDEDPKHFHECTSEASSNYCHTATNCVDIDQMKDIERKAKVVMVTTPGAKYCTGMGQ